MTREDWMKKYPSVFVTRTYGGDRERAKSFYGEGEKLLYQLKNLMMFRDLGQLKMRRPIKDVTGNVLANIIAKSAFGHDEIYISSPFIEEEISLAIPVFPVMATYDQANHNRIFFEVSKKTGDDTNRNFYIDLDSVFVGLGSPDRFPFALNIIEDHPNMGALFYFTPSSYFTGGTTIVFKATTPTVIPNPITYQGSIYAQYDFEYDIEQYTFLDSDIDPIVSPPTVQLGASPKPDGYAAYWVDSDSISDQQPYPHCWISWDYFQAIGTSSGAYDFDIDAQYNWTSHGAIGENPVTPSSGSFTVNRYIVYSFSSISFDKIKSDGNDRYISPIGSAVWLSGGELLSNIDWSIDISCLGEFPLYLYATGSWSVNPSIIKLTTPTGTYDINVESYIKGLYGDPMQTGSPYFDVTIRVPFLLRKSKGVAIQFQDPEELFSYPWVRDNVLQGPVPPWMGWSLQAPGEIPDTWFEGVNVYTYLPIFTSATNIPGSYRWTRPIHSLSGEVTNYIIGYSRVRYGVGDEMRFQGYNIGYFPHIYRLEYPLFPPPPPQASDYYRPFGYRNYHPGGGVAKRYSFRTAVMSVEDIEWSEVAGGSRSIYVVNDMMYDYNQSVPLTPYGRVSKELLWACTKFNMKSIAVLDSSLSGYNGSVNLVGKCLDFSDLNSKNETYVKGDFGLIDETFFNL